MNQGHPTLAEVLMQRLATRDGADRTSGAADLALAFSRLASFAGKFNGMLLGTASVAGLAAGICIALWWPERDHSSQEWFVAMALLTLVAGAIYVRQTIWHHLYRRTFLGWRPKALDDPILAPAYALIEQAANGEVLLETHLGERIDMSFLRNALAPLLASDSEAERLLVRSAFSLRRYGPQLHVVRGLDETEQSGLTPQTQLERQAHNDTPTLPTASDIGLGISGGAARTGAEETPLRNSDPKVQWLVGGTYPQFMLGLASFLNTLAPHKQNWHRIVLTVGRRELRKGGQRSAQSYAIDQAIAALKAAGEKYPDVARGDATTTIKKLLTGLAGTKDITGHFLRHHPENRLNSKDSSDPNG